MGFISVNINVNGNIIGNDDYADYCTENVKGKIVKLYTFKDLGREETESADFAGQQDQRSSGMVLSE